MKYAVLIAACVLLAGCSAVDSSPEEPQIEQKTFTESDIQTHDKQVASFESFSLKSSLQITGSNENNSLDGNITTIKRWDDNRGYEVNTLRSLRGGQRTGFAIETYTTENETYLQTTVASGTSVPDGQTLYSVGDETDELDNNTRLLKESLPSSNVTFDVIGTETFDGDTVTVYQTTNITEISDGNSVATEEIESVEIVIKVDQNGVVRHVYYKVVGTTPEYPEYEQVTVELEHTLTGIDSTTVEEPSWLETAKEESVPR